ncbi:hypothetical protein RBSWK_02102 [Rhodopirellula baltica SWK14]|uniref:Uncharacterized protein n=1 Tax=Rhodopirellula baltica SWK14 TaxID=993516 RepID=L7CLQ1_RHOBT|nr:hypothetical protein RBSWK_02102 [Rhodopirellula baltica SWK14]
MLQNPEDDPSSYSEISGMFPARNRFASLAKVSYRMYVLTAFVLQRVWGWQPTPFSVKLLPMNVFLSRSVTPRAGETG